MSSSEELGIMLSIIFLFLHESVGVMFHSQNPVLQNRFSQKILSVQVTQFLKE